ncbi:MAG: ACP S-malonyltransferase [Desulfobulbaceae bacterium]|nr:ACP S-malonyltransferase [Desulfobulbaceae bacterium]
MTEPRKIAFLFPGQGSQYVGMGKEFLESDPEARALLEQAETLSGYPLRRLCLEGPLEELTRTAYLQPAVTVLNLMALQALARAGVVADMVAGHSLGEYAALCAGGVVSFADGLRLTTERGRLMEREAAGHPGGMAAILGLDIAQVTAIVAAVREQGIITVANHNSAQQIVISGAAAPLAAAGELAAAQGGKAITLKVSGAWHSELVAGAVPDFSAFMATIAFQAPQRPLLFNVTAAEERDPAAIRAIMARQIASPVRWFEIINDCLARGIEVFVEVGPKTVLSGLLKKIVPAGRDHRVFQVDTPAGVEKLVAEL